jgi:hypothetical protein
VVLPDHLGARHVGCAVVRRGRREVQARWAIGSVHCVLRVEVMLLLKVVVVVTWVLAPLLPTLLA